MKPSHTSPATLLPSIWEQNYSLSRLLSIYTHNIIYELTESISGKKYILKILDKKYFHKRLYQTLSLSDCPSLLLPIDLTEDSQFIYFIYEYYPCLTDLLLIREFSYSELFVFVQDIGNAILFLHENHIAHRDIAPGNIFMKEDGHFILGDFSSSRFEKSADNFSDSLLHLIKNFGCRRTGNTPFFSPPDYSGKQNGYYMDCYGFAMLLYLFLNEFKPPSEEDYAELHSFPEVKKLLLSILNATSQQPHCKAQCAKSTWDIKQDTLQSSGVLTLIHCQYPTASSEVLTQNRNKPPDFQTFFCQLKDIFQSTAAENLIFHTAIIKEENTDFFLRTASLSRKNKDRNNDKDKAQKLAAPFPTESPAKEYKPKLTVFLYGLLFLSILIFSISFYRSLTTARQKETNITQSVLSKQEQDKQIFMNKQNLTSLNFLQENHSVQVLVLSENKITSVKPLAELSQLIILDLSCNQQLTDILALTNLQHLQQLILTDTNVTENELTLLKDALTDCTILY